VTKTIIDIDDEMLERASEALGTSTKKDTVNRALAIAAAATPEVRAIAAARLRRLAGRLDLDLIQDMERADHDEQSSGRHGKAQL
jgi:Arc/MetJ family transcription regulator